MTRRTATGLSTLLLASLLFAGGCSDSTSGGSSSGSSGGASGSSSSSGSSGASGSSSGGASSSSSSSSGGADAGFGDPLAGIGTPTALGGTYQFTEGALFWNNKLIFSDIPANTIYELTPPATMPTVFRNPSGNANGNAVGPDGALYTCEHGGKRVSKTVGTTVSTFAATFGGQPLNSPNDVIVRRDGNVYFTDPNYAGNTQPKQHVFRATPAGQLSVVDDALDKPNGIALSPSQNVLYVTSASRGFINQYDVAADGSTSNGRKFVDVPAPDGIAVDDAGNLYVASNKVEVFRPDGTKVGSITVPQQPSNVALGGADRKTLYITARTAVYQVKVNVPGPP
jgi:gluconolactonase